ncbi:MAG: response regulator [Limisphaerales bacterium]
MSARKILVVDDNPVVVKALQIKLAEAGYVAFAALDASEAIAVVRQEQPDLIVLDLSFPPDIGGVDWDGFRLMQWLQRLEHSRRIPIIIITGHDSQQNRQRAIELGATAFFTKPVNHVALVQIVRETLAETVPAST